MGQLLQPLCVRTRALTVPRCFLTVRSCPVCHQLASPALCSKLIAILIRGNSFAFLLANWVTMAYAQENMLKAALQSAEANLADNITCALMLPLNTHALADTV